MMVHHLMRIAMDAVGLVLAAALVRALVNAIVHVLDLVKAVAVVAANIAAPVPVNSSAVFKLCFGRQK
jgi:hypothetical protein